MIATASVLGLGEPDVEALAFPRDVLVGVESALILFASGRGGATDGRWFAEAGIDNVTLVDWDSETLGPMKARSPENWTSLCVDVRRFENINRSSKWDHVSADPPSQLAPEIVERIPRWLRDASKSATITVYRHCFAGEPSLDAPELVPPAGWVFTRLIKRGEFRGGIYWLVAERT